MKLVLLSDIHANLAALEAVLSHARSHSYDHILCMGDLVGYGPQPNEVIDVVRAYKMHVVEGNHDAGVVGRMPLEHFRDPNQTLIKWTREHLHPEHLAFLRALPLTLSSSDLGLEASAWLMAHASPVSPERWDYMDSAMKARKVLSQLPQRFIFVGHTHKPIAIANELGVFGMETGYRYVINPGAVGQSRTEEHKAQYALLNTESMTLQQFQVTYPIDETLRAYDRQGFDTKTRRRLLNMS